MVPAGNYKYETYIIGVGPTQVSTTTLGWQQTSVVARAPSPKEILEQKKVLILQNDRWKSKNKSNMPLTPSLSNRQRARLEKKGKKKK